MLSGGGKMVERGWRGQICGFEGGEGQLQAVGERSGRDVCDGQG